MYTPLLKPIELTDDVDAILTNTKHNLLEFSQFFNSDGFESAPAKSLKAFLHIATIQFDHFYQLSETLPEDDFIALVMKYRIDSMLLELQKDQFDALLNS